jgi:hypothetical protein
MATGSLYRVDTVLSADGHIWFRYEQSILGEAKIEVRDLSDVLQTTISGLGDRPRGEYATRSLAIYWDGEASGSPLAPGAYRAYLFINNVQRDNRKFAINS